MVGPIFRSAVQALAVSALTKALIAGSIAARDWSGVRRARDRLCPSVTPDASIPLPVRAARRCSLVACLPAARAAEPYTPPKGKIWIGLTAGFDTDDFQSRAGKHPAVWQHFIAWGQNYQYTLTNSRNADARLMYHLSTSKGQNLPERFSPGEIARGKGDGYLIQLTRSMAEMGAPTYMRLMGEMNNCNNPYAAYNCSGSPARRRPLGETFIKAWKRAYLIMHGGDVPAINARLAALRLPAVQAGADTLPEPQIAFVWAPMTGGAPNISALRPQVYWPGRRWVDWVGHELLLALPELHRPRPLLQGFRDRKGQAVRDRRVGDLGLGRARASPAACSAGSPTTSRSRWSTTTRAGSPTASSGCALPRLGQGDPRPARPPRAASGSRPSSASYGSRVAAMTRR